jgi:FlaG/FlaF family flagellin (archaellin)
MEYMKANRKFKDKDDAVSAVIGVILMVAITVAIAATVYVYVSGMIGSSPTQTPSVQFVKDDVANKLTVASADPGNLEWDEFDISSSLSSSEMQKSFNQTTDSVTAGDYLYNITGTETISIVYEPTNTLLGTWDFKN